MARELRGGTAGGWLDGLNVWCAWEARFTLHSRLGIFLADVAPSHRPERLDLDHQARVARVVAASELDYPAGRNRCGD
jgi:hypothetical protein